MMKILLLLTFVLMTGAASAQQRTIYDTSGKVVGRSATYTSGTVTNYDAPASSAVNRPAATRRRCT
jgi:hypothetical protein